MRPSRLIVGLGNPGPEYASTRHNFGFMAVDALADMSSGAPVSWQKKFKGLAGQAALFGVPCLLLKPMTFMNLSGESVGEAMRFYGLSASDVIAFHDDIDLDAGRVKVKQGGGNGGHNGLKSLDAHISPDYWRVRLGIGRPEHAGDVTNYVLGAFSEPEKKLADKLTRAAAKHFHLVMEGKTADFPASIAAEVVP